ncbi:LysR family transcriptional regulator [Rhizobium sp. P40RR-XXII]|nr:LysR family transcriptional regulator [Rhizobium sp. P28RR-XV]NLS17966.1 LysR family transcriptional regulator [Rhizobium sp. P40RR-XXII]
MAAIMRIHAVSLPLGAAKLHDIDWNDLRHLLALARGGSFAAAGRALGTDATTVGRRLRILEKRLGTPLFSRAASGVLSPTPTGEIAVAKAEAIEAEVMALSGALDAADPMALGKVRLTAAPSFISRLLIPSLPSLLAQHSSLQLELIGDPRNFNLTRREADMALRLARPADMTNGRVVARRIATLDYAVYVAAGQESHAEDLPWIVYEEAMVHLPHARWIAAQAEKSGRSSPLAVNDAEALLQAAVAGLGRALLPKILAENASGLRRVDSGERNPPVREMWLLMHAELRQLVRIRAVSDWLDGVFHNRHTER